MRTKQLTVLALLLVMLLSLFSGCEQTKEEPLEPPEWMEEYFKQNNKNEPYARGVPLDEMDFSEYWGYFITQSYAVQTDETQESVYLTLPCDVEYYLHKEDKTPAVVLKKGTEVVVGKNLPLDETMALFDMSGYGMRTWPGYEAGWRYGIPFRTRLDYVESLVGAKRYYVKTQQLFEVANAYYNLIDPVDESNYEDFPEMLEYEKEKRAILPIHIALSIDRLLCNEGAFLSPDYIKYYKPLRNPPSQE